MLTCAACGRENPDEARFCLACGTALATPEPIREERKVVTVLFCDLVGFTRRSESMDPEDVRAVLRRYQEHLRGDLERFGGTVEKFIGDAVVAVFGAPKTHEDDPERAVRAAIAIRDWAREEEGLELRIAVNTGEALVTLGARPERGEGMVAGDVVNTAARLQAAAPKNGILVGETTQRATDRVIDYGDVDAVGAKGKARPVPAWEVLQARSRLGADLFQARSPLVGRKAELDLLLGAFGRARDESSPQLVTLLGVPGIGKSRLVYELFNALGGGPELTYWRQGRSLPYGDGFTFSALAEMVKAQTGILETDTPQQSSAKLHGAVRALLEDAFEAEWVESRMRPLLGLAAEDGLASDRRSESFAAWRRFFEAMAEQHALVLVFEDVHWADDGLLEFIEHLVDWATSVPLLVLCTARPELLARRPDWGGATPNTTRLAISPLPDEQTAQLLAALLERAVLPSATQQALLARAGGNPLYAEQYARMLVERGGEDDLQLPESVQGVIAARLDALSLEEKTALQDAAVVGKVFWTGAVGAIGEAGPRESEELLHRLERKEFVQRARRTSVEGETEYAFRHLLVRDVAYGQIPRADRSEKHRLTASWLEGLGRPEDHAETLAHHYLMALDLARASSRPTDELAERGRLAFREAGERALTLNAFDAAARSYAAALELWPNDDPERPRLLLSYGTALAVGRQSGEEELAEAAEALARLDDREHAAQAEILLAFARWGRNRRDEAYAHVDRALSLVSDVPSSPAKARVLSEVSRYHMLAERREDAIETGREALAMATELGLPETRALALNFIGTTRVGGGDLAGLVDIEQSIAIANEIASVESLRGYNNLYSSLIAAGELDRAAAAIEAGLDAARRFGSPVGFARWLMHGRIPAAYWSGRWDEALRIIEEMLVELGPSHSLSRWNFELRGRIRLARGDMAGAVEDARRSLHLGREAKDPQTLHPALSFAAVASLETGNHREAERLSDELLALNPASSTSFHPVSAVFDLAWVLDALGRTAELVAALEQSDVVTRWTRAAKAVTQYEYGHAGDLYAEIGTLPNEAYARLRAAEQLVRDGRRAEADEQLGRALAFYRSVGATYYTGHGERLLAATA